MFCFIQASNSYIFQQDNATPHTAASTLAMFKKHGIKTIKWPPKSPDLNPAEHVWAIMDRLVRKQMCGTTHPTREQLLAVEYGNPHFR